MDQSQIAAPQVGLSDEEWNNSRGTVSDGKDTNSEQEPTRILSEDADSLIVYFHGQALLSYWLARFRHFLVQM